MNINILNIYVGCCSQSVESYKFLILPAMYLNVYSPLRILFISCRDQPLALHHETIVMFMRQGMPSIPNPKIWLLNVCFTFDIPSSLNLRLKIYLWSPSWFIILKLSFIVIICIIAAWEDLEISIVSIAAYYN